MKKIDPCLGNRLLSEITPLHIQGFLSERLKTVKAGTVRNDCMLIKEMFKHAYQWGYIKTNFASIVQYPKYIKDEIAILEPGEAKKLLEHCDNHYKIAYLTAFQTGLRAGELWGLQWGDIDWNSKKIYVRHTPWKGKLTTPKTKNAIRNVDISDTLLHELKIWKLACPVSKFDLVFPSANGKIANHHNFLTYSFYPALRRAGLRHVNFHSIRHTNVSMRIQAGQNAKYISKQIGHSSIKITFDTYGHLFDDVTFNRQQVDLLEQKFQSVRNPLESENIKVISI
jgi:integrase